MSDNTGIEWCDTTWSPVTGCTPISIGCAHCFAARMAKRLQAMGQHKYRNGFKVTLHPKELDKPLHWKKPRRIFVCSMSDLFHEEVPTEFILRIWNVMANCPQHQFIVLTKRAERMEVFTNSICHEDWLFFVSGSGHTAPLPNVTGMVTVENQECADERIPALLVSNFAIRGISAEPLLGPITMGYTFTEAYREAGGKPSVDWVICGGESGPGARPMDLSWARSLRNQCQKAGVAYFMKQLGGVRDKRHLLSDLPEDLRIREYPEDAQ